MVKVNNSEYKFDEVKFYTFCNEYQISFPEGFINYLKRYNDGELESNIIHFDHNDYYIRYFYGITNEECSDIRMVYEWYRCRLPNKCVPIADPDFGNQICMSLENDTFGNIYFWDHETMDTEEDEKCNLQLDDMILFANSFEELLKKITASPY